LVEKGGRKGYIAGMEDAAENGKESSRSAHANGMNEIVKRGLPPSIFFFVYLTSVL
jgi:hypothetical protein